jgi:outer membrane protein insertion porin family
VKRRAGVAAAVALLGFGTTISTFGQLLPEAPVVQEIEIRFVGPETVNRAVVRANVQTEIGQPRNRLLIEQDVRNLIATGHFADVRVLEEDVPGGVRIVYQVQGKVQVREILVRGQRRFREERLRKELTLKVNEPLDERKIHIDRQKLTDFYQKAGYPDIVVTHETSIDPDAGTAVVTYNIEEGERLRIARIEFRGVTAFPPKQLHKLMRTRKNWFLAWMTGAGVIRTEQFEDDLDKLREFYRSKGYIDMEIQQTRVERISAKWVVVHIEIFEGRQYKVGEIGISGNTLFTEDELRQQMPMKEGATFTPDGLNKNIKAIQDHYGARGYLDTVVFTSKIPNVETGRMDLQFALQEGHLTYIDKIRIRGNTKTRDKVIRRELAVAPGDVYNTVRVDASVERLKNLNYFSKVDATPEPTEVPNRRNVVVEVEEQRTGTVTFGAGFSSIDNFIGFVEVTQGNFDLFNWPTFTGGGQKLRLRAQIGMRRQDYVLSFVEPWFLDQRLALGVDIFRRTSRFLSDVYNEDRTGGDIFLEKALSEFVRVRLEYSIQEIDIRTGSAASAEVASQSGSHLRSAMALQLVYDARDSVFLTTRGNRTEFSAEVAGGPLAGDVDIYKLQARSSQFFPFFNQHVLQIVGSIGVVDAFGDTKGSGGFNPVTLTPINDVPIFDRYFLGGANTLRGFRFRQVGPKDETGEPIGGNTFASLTLEYSFPIVERIRGAVFYDVGFVNARAYDFSLSEKTGPAGLGLVNSGINDNFGFGVRLNLPIGPIRLDYGIPIRKDSFTSRSGKFQFSIGYQF